MMFSTELLYDIQPPAPVPFWPPAPGWWIVAILLVSAIGWWCWYYYFYHAFKRIALKKLKQLHKDYQRSGDATQLAMELSILLRRVALVRFPRRQVANLIGAAWLQFLDKTGKTQDFTKGQGQVLCTAPYQKSPLIEANDLLRLVKAWIKQQ
jgi:hypothetical protein